MPFVFLIGLLFAIDLPSFPKIPTGKSPPNPIASADFVTDSSILLFSGSGINDAK
jgi:hypothetical protein